MTRRIIVQPALANDARFDTNPKRFKRHDKVKPLVEAWIQTQAVDDVVQKKLAAGVPASPINTLDRLVVDPHIAVAREMFFDVEQPKARHTKLTGAHIKLTATPPIVRVPAPPLGQHNDAVLGNQLGLPADGLAQLREEGVI